MQGNTDRATWRNPPFGWRVALVGTVWAIPGLLAGLIAAVVLSVWGDPSIPAAVGTGLGLAAGAALEAFG
ncbi:MAG TPA: hypothetical protein VKE74_10355 [Gemmataceae bacterium]|nr:hypothetical protein [Gemmataceae bacterium]